MRGATSGETRNPGTGQPFGETPLPVSAGGSESGEVSAYSTAGRESGRVVVQAGLPHQRLRPKMMHDEMWWWLS